MTKFLVDLPDDLVRQAREAGLLSDAAICAMLEDELRRQALSAEARRREPDTSAGTTQRG